METQTSSAQAPAAAPSAPPPAAPQTPPPAAPAATAAPQTPPPAAPAEAVPSIVAAVPPAPPIPEVPSELKLELPKDVEVDPAVLTKFKEVAGKDFTPQKALDFYTGLVKEGRAAEVKRYNEWQAAQVATLKADPEFGKEFDKNVAIAQTAMARFLTDADRKELDRAGLGNYATLVKAFNKIGKAIAEDTTHQPNPPATSRDAEAQLRALYPSMYNADGTRK